MSVSDIKESTVGFVLDLLNTRTNAYQKEEKRTGSTVREATQADFDRLANM